MKRFNKEIILGAALVVLSVLFYLLHYGIFRDAHHIFIYLIGDIAFVFIEVLMVTLIIHRVLDQRERRTRLQKLNMVIGAFFSEVGTSLLDMLSNWDPGSAQLKKELAVGRDWTDQEFADVSRWLKQYRYETSLEKVDWGRLKESLMASRTFLLQLLENPNLLEHESFTELLQAIFHLTEELRARTGFQGLPDTDYQHLKGDIKRAYQQLAQQWLFYMEHLQQYYPYLFSLALRTNPFDEKASVVVSN